MSSRKEFSTKVKKAAYERAAGICECGCGRFFNEHHPKEYSVFDHDDADFNGGDNTLENCKCIRFDCHKIKTAVKDMPVIKKIRREKKRRTGMGANKRKIPGRRFNGDPIWPS